MPELMGCGRRWMSWSLRSGIVGDIIIGIIGAVVGGFLAAALFGNPDPVNGFNLGTLVVALLGGVVAVAIIRALPGRSPV